MNLLINTATSYKGGSVQVAQSFIESCRDHSEHIYHVIFGPSLAKMINQAMYPDNFNFYTIDYRPATRVFSFRSRTTFFKEVEKITHPHVVFTTSGPAYWRPKAPHLIGYNLPHYIYPESMYFKNMSITNRLKWRMKGAVIRRFFRRDGDAYVVQTEAVSRRVQRFLKTDRVYTVSNTCGSHYFEEKTFSDRLPSRSPGEFRLLTLSAWYPHKNLSIIPRIIEALHEDVKKRVRFVLTLPPEDFAEHFAEGRYEQIINVGPVPIAQGPSLYRECDAMFLPTLLECFSASYPEAMATRKPILTSDLDFARSICQDAATYFDSLDPRAIAHKICELMSSTELQASLIAKGEARLAAFGTAKSRAAQYLKICEELAGFNR